MRRAFLALGLLSCGTVGSTLAVDLIGAGAWSCVAWTETRKSPRSDSAEQSVLMFLSGIEFVAEASKDPIQGLEPQAVAAWMDKYCRRHPNDLIARGIKSFQMTQQAVTNWELKKPPH